MAWTLINNFCQANIPFFTQTVPSSEIVTFKFKYLLNHFSLILHWNRKFFLLPECLLLELSVMLDSVHYSCLSSSLSISDCHPECLFSLPSSFVSSLGGIFRQRNHSADLIKVKDTVLGLTGDLSLQVDISLFCVWQFKDVMVNFVCQLNWAKGCPDNRWNIISGYVCEDVSRRD